MGQLLLYKLLIIQASVVPDGISKNFFFVRGQSFYFHLSSVALVPLVLSKILIGNKIETNYIACSAPLPLLQIINSALNTSY